jgi:hypothetical protein
METEAQTQNISGQGSHISLSKDSISTTAVQGFLSFLGLGTNASILTGRQKITVTFL